MHWYDSDYKVSYVEGYTEYTLYNGEWYTYMVYQGYHVYWDSFSRYYWPAYYEDVGAAPWLRPIWNDPLYWNYNP